MANLKKSQFNTQRLVFCGILCGVALTIFVLESYIPLPFIFPGFKLGLSNIITLFALLFLSVKEAFAILITRILLGAVFAGQPSVLIYSLSGGIASLLAEAICLKIFRRDFICEISIIGAMVHNTAQVLCAALITKTSYVFIYLPPLIIAAIITGAFCGMCILFTDKKFGNKIKRYLNNL